MTPRRVLTPAQIREVIDQSAAQNALAAVTVRTAAGWESFKSRFLESRPAQRFFVLDYFAPEPQRPLPQVRPGQWVGVSVRHRSRKVMFRALAEARGQFVRPDGQRVAAIRYGWPDSAVELQRRAYYRTPVPPGVVLRASLWPGGLAARAAAQSRPLAVASGVLEDLSCGGARVRVVSGRPGDWEPGMLLGAELHLGDVPRPLETNAFYRGTRPAADGALCVAIQFVGLELSPEGRAALTRLARCMQRLHRHAAVPPLPPVLPPGR